MTHYFAAYSNAHRGKEAKGEPRPRPVGSLTRATIEPEEEWIKSRRKTWARLIRRVYESDPLLCKCGGTLKVISVIEARSQSDLVGKILASIQFVFEVLKLTERPPPARPPEPDEDWDDGSRPDAYCF